MSGGPACASVEPSDELDHRVDHRLGVHDDVEGVVRHVEQQVRLDQLQALVDQRRGVGGDDLAHVPGRVGERLRRGHVGELGAAAAAERSAAGRQHEATDLLGAAAAQALRERRVLGVDGDELTGPGEGLDEGPARDERLLVRQREGGAGGERGEGRCEPDRTGDAVEHDVGGQPASSAAACGPASTVGAAAAPCSAACSAGAGRRPRSPPRRPGLDGLAGQQLARPPPAASPTTRNRSGLARTTSSACVPTEPVLPSTTTSRCPSRSPPTADLVPDDRGPGARSGPPGPRGCRGDDRASGARRRPPAGPARPRPAGGARAAVRREPATTATPSRRCTPTRSARCSLAADGEAVGCVAVQPLRTTVPGAPAEVGEVKRLYVAPPARAAAAGLGCSWPRRRRSRRRPGSGSCSWRPGCAQPEALGPVPRSRVHRHRAVRPLPRQPAVGVPHRDARPARGREPGRSQRDVGEHQHPLVGVVVHRGRAGPRGRRRTP